jgi:hypothetical protein
MATANQQQNLAPVASGPSGTTPSKASSAQEALLFPLGHREHHSTRVGLLAALWTIVGILALCVPTIFKITDALWINLCSVFGALIISSAGIGTVNSLFLRRSQQNETRQILAEDLTVFQRETTDAFLERVDWVRGIETAGIRNVTLTIPDKDIDAALCVAKDEKIRFLFASYATISKYDKAIREALQKGATVDIIVADPKTNTYLAFMEADPSFQSNNERMYAEICVSNVRKLRAALPATMQARYSLFLYDMPPSIVAVQIGQRYWFGVLWAHAESFHGPWFEVRGDDKSLAAWLSLHIDRVATSARKEP